jgi:hypothetical protein
VPTSRPSRLLSVCTLEASNHGVGGHCEFIERMTRRRRDDEIKGAGGDRDFRYGAVRGEDDLESVRERELFEGGLDGVL